VTLRSLAAWALSVALLSGCANLQRPGAAPATDQLGGRLTIRVEGTEGAAARALSASFELQGNARQGSLNLSTPLGTVLAQARWSASEVVLATPQGERNFSDLDALTREVLGESVPVVALFDWLRGRPWPGARSEALVPATEPGFQQLGWAVSLAHFDEAWVAARREQAPPVSVRVKLDRP
jgi:outer membrane lipoprotein LolB